MSENKAHPREIAAYHLGHAKATMLFDMMLVGINLGMLFFFPTFALLHALCALLFGIKCYINASEITKLKEKYAIDEETLKVPL